MRRATVTKTRPDHWADSPELGRHDRPFGVCTVEEKGRDVVTVWTVDGLPPVRMPAKAKYRP